MKYTVQELIERLQQFPKNTKVQLDIEGAIYDEMNIEAGQGYVIIFSEGESSF
jgi:hypothetical protein